jgi:predicted RNA binding protein YcfA (HicA-like mRNA interferase family)
MSRKLPAVRPEAVIRALERAGFVLRRIRGSHHQLSHRDRPELRTTVPVGNRDLRRGTLHAILRDCEITPEQFLELLRQ